MASDNRAFPCNHANFVPMEQTFQAYSRPCSSLSVILFLLWFCCNFNLNPSPCDTFSCISLCGNTVTFSPPFARMHHFAKIVLYVTAELLKRILFGVIILVQHKNLALKQLHSQYAYFNIACIACFTLHIQWLAFRTSVPW